MSSIRRRTTRRRAAFLFNSQESSEGEKGNPFEKILKALDKADSVSKVIALALRNDLTFFRRPMDAIHYRKVNAKVSQILSNLVVPLLEEEKEKYPYTDGLIPMNNLNLRYKFITNMQYFPTTGKFQIRDPFLMDALIPDEQNNVFVTLYLRMPTDLEELPEVNEFPNGAIPFLRITYKIVRGNRLYTGETREKWTWNVEIPVKNPIVLGMRNGETGRLTVDITCP